MSRLSSSETKPDSEVAFSAVVVWMREHGGGVDSRLTVMPVAGVRGIVACNSIEEGTVLIHCPWELIIGSSSKTQSDELCEMISALERELRQGEDSFWYPYLKLNEPGVTRLPTLWDAHTLLELQGLPPYDATRHTHWFSVAYHGGKPLSELGAPALQLLITFVTRSNRRGMIPVYELLNHHNGKLNTVVEVTETGFRIVASRFIPAGGQIFTTYGTRSTPEMFRDYNFIEQWPQNWFWTDRFKQTHTFVRFPDEVIAIEPTELFTAEFGVQYLPLDIYQQRARDHTGNLSAESLRRFQSAARTLLESLPTSAGEDEKILKTFGELALDGESAKTKLKDLTDCVQYRLEFKRAIQAAIAAAQKALAEKGSPD